AQPGHWSARCASPLLSFRSCVRLDHLGTTRCGVRWSRQVSGESCLPSKRLRLARLARPHEEAPGPLSGLQRRASVKAVGVRRGPAVGCCRRLLAKSGIGWNRPSLRSVVEGVRKLRAVAAVLVASCVVVAGCTSSGEEEAATASEPVVEPPSNPWDLPLEQRPPLFDP